MTTAVLGSSLGFVMMAVPACVRSRPIVIRNKMVVAQKNEFTNALYRSNRQ